MASFVVEAGLRSRIADVVAGSAREGLGGSGVRAQALKADGTLVDDFQFVPSGKVLHVLNVPSPAATASLMIGKAIVDTAAVDLGLNG
jgi:L-2-hydroxyglutarate oxidase LhgO